MVKSDKSFRVHCGHCMTFSLAKVHGDYIEEEDQGNLKRVYLGACVNCMRPLVMQQWESGWNDDLGPLEVQFPLAVDANPSWPAEVRDSYSEADACFKANAFNATAVMCRKTLEHICKELNVKGTLNESLEKLGKDGTVDTRILEWAHGLRGMGNVGAHAGTSKVSREDARDILDFSRALIDYIFTYALKFKSFKDRQAAKKAESSSSGESS